jgi:hypothetical protein
MVATPRDAARAAEQLLTRWVVRQWILNFDMVRRARAGRDILEHQPWIPEDLTPRLRVLSRCVDAFNRWASAKPGVLPPSLSLLLEDSLTPNFHRAFDDGRLPASVRLAYYSHRTVGLHAVALFQAHDGALPSMVVPSVVDALRTDVRRALGLALGIPGVEGVREQLHVDLDDVEILDLDAEQAAWYPYLSVATWIRQPLRCSSPS